MRPLSAPKVVFREGFIPIFAMSPRMLKELARRCEKKTMRRKRKGKHVQCHGQKGVVLCDCHQTTEATKMEKQMKHMPFLLCGFHVPFGNLT